MEILFRFDKPRKNQDVMINEIYNALSEKKSIIINAPTGIGKTDASISAALSFALESNTDILFLTPKISQHRMAIEVINGINKKYGTSITYADIVGKYRMCTNPDVNLIESSAFYKICDELVKSKKCPFYQYYESIKGELPGELEKPKDHISLMRDSFDFGLCGYEVAAELARKAKVVICGYSHLLNPMIRGRFIKRIGKNIENCILIWDEAHNIIDIANSYLTVDVSLSTLNKAEKELEEIGSSVDLFPLRELFYSLSKKANGDEAFVEREDIPELFLENSEDIADILENEGIRYLREKKKKRSSLFKVANLVRRFGIWNEESKIIVGKEGEKISLRVASLFPKEPLEILKDAYANVFMSGTMFPLKMYKDLFSIKDARTLDIESPFLPTNKLCFIDNEVSTKFTERSEKMYKRLGEKLDLIRKEIKGNMCVFFPSFSVLENVERYINHKNILVQKAHMRTEDVAKTIEKFISSNDSMLLGVMGGSLSEGVDYPNNSIKCIAIVGIPLAKPNLEIKAKIALYESMFGGNGEKYAYILPGLIKSIQSAGRAIRNEKDRCVIIFIDRRYEWNVYRSIIGRFYNTKIKSDYLKDTKDFLNEASEKSI
ncbi:MAG: ATP-dependent DNA helicase [Candidatus Micrarchaeaceae archaeon]